MRKIKILLALFVASPLCFSAKSEDVGISRVSSLDTGVSILWANQGWGSAGNNECSTGTGVLAFNSTTESGKSMLSLALAAYMA